MYLEKWCNVCCLMEKIIGMDPVIILIVIAALLLVYQLFLAKDPDKLDAYGHEVYKKGKGSVEALDKLRERIMNCAILVV